MTKKLDKRAFDRKYSVNTLIIKQPKGPKHPYVIMYQGFPLDTILVAMKVMEDKKDIDWSQTFQKGLIDAVEDIKSDAKFQIAIERSDNAPD